MKFSQTIIACLLLISLSGQIQNGSFERWSDTSGSNLPIGWQSQTHSPIQDSIAVRSGSYSVLLIPEAALDSYTTPNLIQFFSGSNGNQDTLYFWLDASDTIKRKQELAFIFLAKAINHKIRLSGT